MNSAVNHGRHRLAGGMAMSTNTFCANAESLFSTMRPKSDASTSI